MYRKPTHTDLYLPLDSNHNISAKYSVINTLSHRAHTICSTPELAEEELKHLEQVLGQCKYPKMGHQEDIQETTEQREETDPYNKTSCQMPQCNSIHKRDR